MLMMSLPSGCPAAGLWVLSFKLSDLMLRCPQSSSSSCWAPLTYVRQRAEGWISWKVWAHVNCSSITLCILAISWSNGGLIQTLIWKDHPLMWESARTLSLNKGWMCVDIEECVGVKSHVWVNVLPSYRRAGHQLHNAWLAVTKPAF